MHIRKKGFTLLELMVVVAIIAVIASVMMGGFFGASESANQAKCLVNMKNLFSLVNAKAMASGYYPPAQSYEYVDLSSGKEVYRQHRGWIGWNAPETAYDQEDSAGQYADSSRASSSWRVSLAGDETATYTAITNSSIWKTSGGNVSSYVCPSHKKQAASAGYSPAWSYVMNSAFRYDSSGSNKPDSKWLKQYGSISSPHKLLMFAEVPFIDTGRQKAIKASSSSSDSALDSVLQYDDKVWNGKEENIAFNHAVDGKTMTAHICFADGHTEKIVYPSQDSNLKDLTKWLCSGTDIQFVSGRYKNSEDEEE